MTTLIFPLSRIEGHAQVSIEEVNGQVVCDEWGDAGWCKGNASLELTASDPQGYAVTINGDLNGTSFSCGDACSLPLPEGRGTASYTAIASSGERASGSSSWRRDSTPPSLNLDFPPVNGENGWYVSALDVTATASDVHSGVLSVQASIDKGASWNPLPLHLGDGVYPVAVKARDIAGNESMVTDVFYIDTVPPLATILEPAEGTLVQETLMLSGKVDDATSGPVGGGFSCDGGVTWQPFSVAGDGTWSFQWDSQGIPNGPYTLLFQGVDRAGNLGSPGQVGVLMDNRPPSVSLTRRWWIWETGTLQVSPNTFPIGSVRVTIRDKQDRWPVVVLAYDPDEIPGEIWWDRRFGNGVLAPPGEYPVDVRACDVHNLCGSAFGVIVIPDAANETATPRPTPTITATAFPMPTTQTAVVVPPTVVSVMPLPETTAMPVQEPLRTAFPWWPMLGLVGLMLAIASASVVDPRPRAINRLKKSMKQISDSNYLFSSQDGD